MTCLYWTIYSWKGFNLFGCPLMLRTKYRCVQSPNMSVDVAKCWENVHKFTQYTHFLSVTRNDLSWLNNLLMVMFPLIRMSSYAKNKPQMCSVTQHYFTLRQMWGKFSQFHPSTLTFCLLQKNDMSLLNNLFMVRFQLIQMSFNAKKSPNMSVDVAKCGEIFTDPVHSLFEHICHKKWPMTE